MAENLFGRQESRRVEAGIPYIQDSLVQKLLKLPITADSTSRMPHFQRLDHGHNA